MNCRWRLIRIIMITVSPTRLLLSIFIAAETKLSTPPAHQPTQPSETKYVSSGPFIQPTKPPNLFPDFERANYIHYAFVLVFFAGPTRGLHIWLLCSQFFTVFLSVKNLIF